MRAVQRSIDRARFLTEAMRRGHVPAASAVSRGRALLSYFPPPRGSLPTHHTQHWESAEIARLLAEAGFDVDVISYQNRLFRPRHAYAMVVDVRGNLERFVDDLPIDCRKVMHLDTANVVDLVIAELARLRDVQERRGVTLRPRRYERPNRSLELADAGTVLGNETTVSTWRYAGVPLHPLPLGSAVTWPFDDAKDLERARRRFLWLGSYGMVHKGLDLTLEAFAREPDLHLTVCGPVADEPDFVEAYRRELFDLPNIETVGFVDVGSDAFSRLIADIGALIYPSSSEGCAGAVVTAMHAGLVPVVSRWSGIDLPPGVGSVLERCDVDEVRAAVRALASTDPDDLRAQGRAAWELARTRFTRERFTIEYRRALTEILGDA